ncbi:MAG: 6-carboxytetrahydropterin synthase [Fimbriimonas ginsengisoli]|uniref:6-carboxy-5,6,7,8-tetrahydropterin synthase n=1 Tax=Fimbriimonas ginsengisoli TaxID=1005039 RepID=A0A931PV03_FIMGI|nr:6-carboxytetrahydropterin synthase [Fimbriimonas ginsengisoli]MBI3721986.1 6-carboxytetrahydropterin synthase [Fimbriimonas ginsengisoli]
MASVRLTRQVSFSSGHRYWLPGLSEKENRALFGRWASRYNHGHNYLLEATVEGPVDPATGMVVNIKRIDDLLQAEVVDRFDGKSLNDEISELAGVVPCVENLLRFVWKRLSAPGALPATARLAALRLQETPEFYGEMTMDAITLTRVYEFAASHRLHAPGLSEKENLELYGKCNNPAGHGHNYLLEVTVSAKTDPRTGMSVDLNELDQSVSEQVVERYDHRNLSEDLPEFAGKPATSEVVAMEIFERLKGRVPGELIRIRLHETARNIFEVGA